MFRKLDPSSSTTELARLEARGVTGPAGPRGRAPTRARPSRCACRWPTATATSTSPTPPDDWLSVEDAIAASTAAGVPRIVQIGCDLPGARWAVETANRYDELVAGVALHPNEAPLLAMAGTLDAGLAEIDALAADPVVRAVGETGLDHYRTGPEGAPTRRSRSGRTSRWPSGTARRW